MAVLVSESFEGGANGAAVTTGNTTIDAIGAGATWTFTNSGVIAPSTLACRATFAGATSNARWTLPTAGVNAWCDAYIRVSEVGTARALMWVAADTTLRAAVRILGSGAIQIRNGQTQVAVTTATVSAGQWFRVAWRASTGVEQRLRLYTSAPFTTVTEEISGTFNTGTFDRFRIGADQNHTGTVDFDGVIVDDAAWPNRGGTADVAWTLNAVYGAGSTPTITSWVLDATASTGAVSVAQTGGTTATVVESPTDVFTITNPTGLDTLTFDVTAVDGGSSDTVPLQLHRATSIERPAMWVFQGGGASDIANWR